MGEGCLAWDEDEGEARQGKVRQKGEGERAEGARKTVRRRVARTQSGSSGSRSLGRHFWELACSAALYRAVCWTPPLARQLHTAHGARTSGSHLSPGYALAEKKGQKRDRRPTSHRPAAPGPRSSNHHVDQAAFEHKVTLVKSRHLEAVTDLS